MSATLIPAPSTRPPSSLTPPSPPIPLPYLRSTLLEEAQARPEEFGPQNLLDLARVVAAVQHNDPPFYGPALDGLLRLVHRAYKEEGLELPTE